MNLNGSGKGGLSWIDDTVDWWQVYFDSYGDLRITLDVPSGQNFDLQVYNYNAPSGFIKGSYRSTGQDEEVVITPTYSGPYYIKVYTSGFYSGNYTLYNEVLAPNHNPILSNGSVSPSTGFEDTHFTYRVTYKDPDGDAPAAATVQIDGSGGSHERNMTFVSGSYATGAIYEYKTYLNVGLHSYYFLFTDGRGGMDDTNVVEQPNVVNDPPEVSISAPYDGQTISANMVTVEVTAFDREDGAVNSIQYAIDGVTRWTDYFPLDQSPASDWDWYTSGYSQGWHEIRVTAWDDDNASSSDEIDVWLERNDAPLLSQPYVTPDSGSVTTQFMYYVTYTDVDGDAPTVATVNIDGSGGSYAHDMAYVSGSFTSGAVYKYVTYLPVGSHSFYCLFQDGNGAQATSNLIYKPSVADQPPMATITSPADGATISGIQRIEVEAADIDGLIDRVAYYIDGGAVPTYIDYNPTATSPSFSHYDWLTFLQLNGSQHQVRAVAYDNKNNTGEDVITVYVDNRDYITVERTPEPATAGNQVLFRGKLHSGQASYRNIYINSFAADLLRQVQTNSSGEFTFSWIPTSEGNYDFQFGFAYQQSTFGDAFDYFSVLPGISKILSVDFSPASGTDFSEGEDIEFETSVAIQTGNSGVLQVLVTGNGISEEKYTYISYAQSTVRHFDFALNGHDKPGSYTYHVFAQFKPYATSGPLTTSGPYDLHAFAEYEAVVESSGPETITGNLPAHFSTFALPFDMADKSIASVFGGSPPRFIYSWNPATNSYAIYPKVPGYQTFNTLEVGRGYLVYSDTNRNLPMQGDTHVGAHTVSLQTGWNLISNSTGVKHVPVLGVSIEKNGNVYSLDGARDAGLIESGIYELKDGSWQPAKFMKQGEGYFIYANTPAQLTIYPAAGPYLTSLSEDSFQGFVPGSGVMDIGLSVPSGTTRIEMNVSGADAAFLNISLFDENGVLRRQVTDASTYKEIVFDNPDFGKWNLTIASTQPHTSTIQGQIFIHHPEGGQYSALSVGDDDGPGGFASCIFGSLGYGDMSGSVGLSCDIGPNLLGLSPYPHPYIIAADEIVDAWQIIGSLLGSGIVSTIVTGETQTEDWKAYFNRLWPNVFALIPYLGDGTQVGTKFLKYADEFTDVMKLKRIRVFLKEGENINDLPAYYKVLDNNDLSKVKKSWEFSTDEILEIKTSESALKGKTAEKIAKQFDEQIANARGVMDASTPLNQATGKLSGLGLQKQVDGKTLGLGSYDPANWNVPSNKIFVKRADGAIESVGVGTDAVFMHEGKLYIKEVKNVKEAEWRNLIYDEDILTDLKDIQRTFDTEFPQTKAEVLVQSFDETPEWVVQAFQDAGVRLVKME